MGTISFLFLSILVQARAQVAKSEVLYRGVVHGAPKGWENFQVHSDGERASGRIARLVFMRPNDAPLGQFCAFSLKRLNENRDGPSHTARFVGDASGCWFAEPKAIYGYFNLDRPDAPGMIELLVAGKPSLKLPVASVSKIGGE